MRTSTVGCWKVECDKSSWKKIVQRKGFETNNSLYLVEIQMRGLILLRCSPASTFERQMRIYSSHFKKKCRAEQDFFVAAFLGGGGRKHLFSFCLVEDMVFRD